MAITKTTKVHRVETYPPVNPGAGDTINLHHPSITVIYEDTLDDPDDAELPLTVTRVKYFTRYVEDGGSATDMTGENQIVQDIAAALWT